MSFSWIDNLWVRLSGNAAGEPDCGGTRHREDDHLSSSSRTEVYLRPFSRQWLGGALALCLFLLVPAPARAANQIINTAWLTTNEKPASLSSVSVPLVLRSPSTLELLRYTPGSPEQLTLSQTEYSPSGLSSGPFVSLPQPQPAPGDPAIDLSHPLPLTASELFREGDPIFIRLIDLDQNLYGDQIETVLITVTSSTGDQELLRLYETGPDTGLFAGYIQSQVAAASVGDSRLNVTAESTITVNYADSHDDGDIAATAGLFDPYGIVFDSLTGLPVDGAIVTLYEVNGSVRTLATVYGIDGSSSYPAIVTSGGSASDSSGRLYPFPAGGYRFPLMRTGTYQIEITPPLGYSAPSIASTIDLQSLPAAPFAILEPGSRGEAFLLNPVPILRLDIPVDPNSSGLWVEKVTAIGNAAIGDYLPYSVRVSNKSANGISFNSVLTDRLPRGFRYQDGSARIDGLSVPDPLRSNDGETLTFTLGNLAPQQGRTVTYVALVGVGTRPGKAINRAQATADNGVSSNTATATVQITEELLRSRSHIVGQVYKGKCNETPDQDGLEGIRLYLEDGTYVVTDREGRYHFEGVRPGTHVVQLDPDSIPTGYEILPCEENNRFAGVGNSQFVDLQGGTLWRADFQLALPTPKEPEVVPPPPVVAAAPPTPVVVLPPPPIPVTGAAAIRLTSTTDGVRTMTFAVEFEIATVPLENASLLITLPVGVSYRPGSASRDDLVIPVPEKSGRSVRIPLGEVAAGSTGVIKLSGDVDPRTIEANPTATAQLLFSGQDGQEELSTPSAANHYRLDPNDFSRNHKFVFNPHFASGDTTVTPEDRVIIDQLAAKIHDWQIGKLAVIGHSDNIGLSKRIKKRFSDNMALSRGRATAVADYLASKIDLTQVNLLKVGMGESLPLASNKTEAGRAQNRRVELKIETIREERIYKILPVQQDSGKQAIDTAGWIAPLPLPVPVPAPEPVVLPEPAVPAPPVMPTVEVPVTGSLPPAKGEDQTVTGILSPADGALLLNAIQSVRVRLDGKFKPQLLLDGVIVPAERIGFSMVDKESHLNLYSYIGVNFGPPGEHELIIRGLDPFGNSRFEHKAKIKRSGRIVELRQIDEGQNIADGKSPVRMRIEMKDEYGNIVQAATSLELLSSTLRPVVDGQESEASRSLQIPLIAVDAEGWITFAPMATSGEQRAEVRLNEIPLTIKTYVKPYLRDWILVGLADGTLGYNAVSGNMQGLDGADQEENFYEDGRMAFFAKGKVKGEWLLTAAYDSGKAKEASLYNMIDPDAYYMLYGDQTQQAADAASSKKLYVKLEREQFYLLFGDFDAGLTVTELSRYSRSLTGLKSEYVGKNFNVKAFASETAQAYLRDELPGDGTSGLYHLSRAEIVLNSEKITLEVRDRFHSEVVISTRTLFRNLDYDIDYTAGTLFFKEPITSRDADFNPQMIIVEYETLSRRQADYDYGARVAVTPLGERLEVGASHIRIGGDNSTSQLTGLDAQFKLNESTRLKGEVARSSAADFGLQRNGNAYLAELDHRGKRLEGRLYLREQDGEFGLGQQARSETGTRKIGGDGKYALSEKLSLRGELSRQSYTNTGSEEDLASVEVNYHVQDYSLLAGIRQARDRSPLNPEKTSTQLISGATWQASSRLALRLNHDQSLGQGESADYPTRTIAGGDYRLSERVTLFGEQEWTKGAAEDTSMTRLGLKSSPWSGGVINSAVQSERSEAGPRLFATVGLLQNWQVTETWSVDAGLDRSQTLRHPGNPIVGNALPSSGGSDDFTAISLGANRKVELWSWSNRLEYRISDSQDKWGLFSGIEGEVQKGVALSAKAQIFSTQMADHQDQLNGDLRLGLAWRPRTSRWIVFDRLDYIFDKLGSTALDYNKWRLINNVNANFKANRRTQLSLQYGAKYVQDEIEGQTYGGYTDLTGLEGRYDLNKSWDIGVQGQLLHGWESAQLDYRLAPSVGYRVMKNAWLSVGYNLVGFQDQDFSAAEFTAQGPFIKFRFKFDQQSLREALQKI